MLKSRKSEKDFVVQHVVCVICMDIFKKTYYFFSISIFAVLFSTFYIGLIDFPIRLVNWDRSIARTLNSNKNSCSYITQRFFPHLFIKNVAAGRLCQVSECTWSLVTQSLTPHLPSVSDWVCREVAASPVPPLYVASTRHQFFVRSPWRKRRNWIRRLSSSARIARRRRSRSRFAGWRRMPVSWSPWMNWRFHWSSSTKRSRFSYGFPSYAEM